MKIVGIDKRNLPIECGILLDITVVLTLGAVNDFAAYYGCGSPEFVSLHGNKISAAEAAGHFPEKPWENEGFSYRR